MAGRRARSLASVAVAACLLLPVAAAPAGAAPGDLDPTFGGDGRVTTDFTAGFDGATGVALQADGKVVVVGGTGVEGANPMFAVVRYNPDGTLDPTFGGDGRVTTDFTGGADRATGVAVQPDGKIVVVGTAGADRRNPRFAVARYEPDGDLDPTFGGGDGVVRTNFTPGFDAATDLALQGDGNIVAAGLADVEFGLARYLAA
jgi:uncharacterized delta-60 repeat protein